MASRHRSRIRSVHYAKIRSRPSPVLADRKHPLNNAPSPASPQGFRMPERQFNQMTATQAETGQFGHGNGVNPRCRGRRNRGVTAPRPSVRTLSGRRISVTATDGQQVARTTTADDCWRPGRRCMPALGRGGQPAEQGLSSYRWHWAADNLRTFVKAAMTPSEARAECMS